MIDIARLAGVDRIAQVDLGVRAHRNRPLRALSPQAMEVLHAALRRAGVADHTDLSGGLRRPDAAPMEIQIDERPPLLDTPGYRGR
jgi:glucosyl-3-phosphoglycerate synthase